MIIALGAKQLSAAIKGKGNYGHVVIKSLIEYYPENKYLFYFSSKKGKQDNDFLASLPNVELKAPPSLVSNLRLNTFWHKYFSGRIVSKDKPQLYHGLNNELPASLSKNIKKVVTIHDLLFFRHPEMFSRLAIRSLKAKVKSSCERADLIVATNQQTVEDLKSLFNVADEKIVIIYPGFACEFDFDDDAYDLQVIKDRYKLPDDFILNSGPIEKNTNIIPIIKAIAINKNKLDVSLVLAGKDSVYKKEIISLAAREGIEEKIHFIPNATEEDLPKIYHLSKVFVYTSLIQSFNFKLVEALCAHVPIIASKFQVFKEVAGQGAVYVNPLDAEEIASAILNIFNNPVLTSKLILKGDDHVKKFSHKRLADQLMEAYNS